ncbi:unnamed protein product [Phytomonas sp. Hart1]|nr:unnamed protein product [Phytomonas sp. Hart1]|eukprot:CCW68257.1 unnamed protein product [Phytomonas sp. isolate Hart1]
MDRHHFHNTQGKSEDTTVNPPDLKLHNSWQQQQKQAIPTNFHSLCSFAVNGSDPAAPKRSTDAYKCHPSQPPRYVNSMNSNNHSLYSSPTPLLGARDLFSETFSSLLSHGGIDTSLNEVPKFSNHSSFSLSFRGDKCIKETTNRVVIGGNRFVIVSYAISGHCDAVYRRSRKIWERIPLGLVHVFRSLSQPPSEVSSSPSPSPVGRPGLRGKGHGGPESNGNPVTGSPPSPGRNGPFYHSSPSLLPVAALNGMRRFGDWNDAVAYGYSVNKAAPLAAIAIEKIDGEGGMLTAFSVDKTRYWVIGCRSTYLILRIDSIEDMQLYDDDSSVRLATSPSGSLPGRSNGALAKRMALLWYRLLKEHLSPDRVEQLHQELSSRQWTCCFDAVVVGWENTVNLGMSSVQGTQGVDKPNRAAAHGNYSQANGRLNVNSCARGVTGHVVQTGHEVPNGLPGSGGDMEGFLVFYAATVCDVLEKGLCVPVLDAMDFFQRYHLPTASYYGPFEMNSPEYDTYRAQVSGQINSVGAVLYGTNELGVVVRIWKCRSYPHIMERVAQELIVTNQLQDAELLAKIEKKLSGLPKGTRVYTIQWKKQRVPFLVKFAAWLHQTMRLTPSTNLSALRELRSYWITTQNIYQKEAACKQVDGEPTMEGVFPSEEATVNNGNVPHLPDVLMLVGPQGSGKSTLARALFALLEQSGFLPLWVNQDEASGRCGYLAAIRRGVSGSCYTHIILDKMNISNLSRLDYVPMKLNLVLTVAWTHSEGIEALAELCFERVKRRGSNHRTFGIVHDPRHPNGHSLGVDLKAQLQRVRGIIHSCAKQYDLPVGDPTLLEVDATLNCNTIVRQVWLKLQERGHHNLPNLSNYNIANALRVSVGYERLITQYPYHVAAVVLKSEDDAALHGLVPPGLLKYGKCKVKLDSAQIRLHDFIVNPSPTVFVRYSSLIGKMVVLRVTAIVADQRATLLCFSKHSAGNGSSGPSWPMPKRDFVNSAHISTLGNSSRHSTHGAEADRHSNIRMGETSLPVIAVLSKAKTINHQYCVDLIQRVLNSNKPDPCCIMLPLQEQFQATFTYQFVAKS